MKSFKKTFGNLDADAAAQLASAAADIALTMDANGVIRDISIASDELPKQEWTNWIGRHWADTVTIESRPKIDELLKAVSKKGEPRWRQVNHDMRIGADMPVRYCALQFTPKGSILAIGRELRSVAALQQKLVETQQSVEREYSRLRHAETRYRMLFQLAADPVLIIDAMTLRVVETNPAASRVLGKSAKRQAAKTLLDHFDPASQQALRAQIANIRGTGRTNTERVRLIDNETEVTVALSLFRQENASYFLVRLTPLDMIANEEKVPTENMNVLRVVQRLPDAFIVTDTEQRILTANPAFLELSQLATLEQVRGQPIERWLGRTEVDLQILLSNLRQNDSVRRFSTVVRGEYGAVEDVEVSAVSAANADVPCFGFTVRTIGRQILSNTLADREMPRSISQLTELVGRVPMKNLVRETTDLIERMCIEAALELVRDNRASAAEVLGLSRQSLYVKMRRYGLGDLTSEL